MDIDSDRKTDLKIDEQLYWDCSCDCSESCEEKDCILCQSGSIKIKKIVYFIDFQNKSNKLCIKYKK